VRKVYVPFSVSSLAQAAALASLDAAEELMARVAQVVAERSRVRDGLIAAGYPIPETQANFVWLPLGEQTAAFAEHALAGKVVVRPFVGDGARVTIGTPEENDAFLAAARSFSQAGA
jgi:histidinol-phosphate aminotransferase